MGGSDAGYRLYASELATSISPNDQVQLSEEHEGESRSGALESGLS